jgi:general L-amino acid transport system permease protein
MAMTDLADRVPLAQQPPKPGSGRVFFGSPVNSAVSVTCLLLIGYVFWHVLDWGVMNAVWTDAGGPEACHASSGACWAIINARWRLILFGLYPFDEHWRSGLACVVVVLTAILSCLPVFWQAKRLATLWVCGFAIFYILMRGGMLGLASVPEEKWGGLSLTVFIFASGVLVGMPVAIGLALLRRSTLPVISRTTGAFIDAVRSLPLVSILFTAAVIFPFVLPPGFQGEQLYRVIAGFALFFAVYQAEIIRGGIQSIPVGQDEAAKALGLSYWQRVRMIILPQAFRYALPPTINQIVTTFKETSLVVIVGFFEIMASGNAAYGTGEWTFAYVEVYAFIAMIYFAFVFTLSRYGAYLERVMRVGQQ